MTASLAELQDLTDQMLEALGIRRIDSGALVIHIHEGRVRRVETQTIHRPSSPRQGLLKNPLDTVHGNGAG